MLAVAETQPQKSPARPPVVLVVDDEPGISRIMVDAATEAGWAAHAAPDWRTAEALVGDADLILLDLMMPGIDGVAALRALAAAKVRSRIVLVSGLDGRVLDSARRVARMQNLDVVDVLRKPFRPAQLRDLLSGLAAHPIRGPELIPAPPGSTATLDEIRHALAKGEFVLHFQPQLRVGDRAWVGVEALVRWSHPTLGLLRPEAFIPQVEVSDLALPFTYAIMAQALDALAAIERDTGFSGRLSVNVPPAALTIADFPDRVLRLLTAAGVDSSRLTIEITETSIAVDPTLSLDIQTRLRMHGVRLSIDDFGTGHSSLERLHEAPFDEMKIDMVLVRNADRDPSLRKIAEGAIALGRSLAMTVVAEGVEAEETLVWLARVGCDLAQGYGIGRPMGGAELRRWAAAHRAAASGRADGIDLAPARRVSTN